jgi:hypothetical protein
MAGAGGRKPPRDGMQISIDPQSPYVVRELKVTETSSTTALLTWKDPSEGAQQLVVYKKSQHDATPSPELPGPERGQSTFSVASLNPDLTYCFFVVSIVDGAHSPRGVGLRTNDCPAPRSNPAR